MILHQENEQSAGRAQICLENYELLGRFALLLAVIVAAMSVATLFGGLFNGGAARF